MTMTPVEWTAVKEILDSALECEPADRPSYLEQACGGNGELRQQIEELIEADERAWSLMEAPALAASSLAAATARVPASGDRIGAYEILQEIGHGGMGVVYLARRADDQFDKKVAIKLARAGTGGDWLERRFRSERQIVASLDHPNIARLLDGGATADGRAYLVMEYVEGEPLGQWCETHRLDTRRKLEIFLEACAAVAYAHQHLVVHRDLKPPNILVTAEGSVKLLDFGIAKLIAPELSGESAEQTGTLFRVFTPDYASPEQIRGEPVSTASDVYALGVVLYELLTSSRPYRTTDLPPAELIQTICEKEPPKASTVVKPPLSRELAGDLDTIVATALRKETGRRYATVGALADDVRRYLAGHPIEARTDAFGYRAGKFVRRHRTAVAAAMLVLAALAGGIVMTSREARRARAAEARVERQFKNVRKLANSIVFEIHDSIVPLPGSTPARALLVKRAVEYLDSLSRENGSEPGLRRELATAYQKVGDVLGRAGGANLGDTKGAQANYRKALRLRQDLFKADPDNRDLALELAQTYTRLSETQKAVEIVEPLARALPRDTAVQIALEVTYHTVATGLELRKEYEKALEYRRKQLAVAEMAWQANPGDRRARRDLAIAYKYVGGRLEDLHLAGEGVTFFRKAAALDEALCAGQPAGSPSRLDLSYDYGGIGSCLATLGDLSAGLQNYQRALALRKEVAEADPKNVNARAAVTRAERMIGSLLGKSGDFAAALQSLERALRTRRELARSDPANPRAAYEVSQSLADIAELRTEAARRTKTPDADRRKHWTEARTAYQESREVLLGLQRRGLMQGMIDKDLEKITEAIGRCDVALKTR